MATRSPALAYAELLAGGVVLYAAVKGASLSDVLTGRSSPIRPLASSIPTEFEGPSMVDAAFHPSKNDGVGMLSASGYAFPFNHEWTWERTDQGVDFGPAKTGAPIYSPGNAQVVKLGAPGWPSGGKGVLLKLLDGPLKGKYVFIYEAIAPEVKVGQTVRAGQQIGHGVFGETGVEIGFANSAGTPLSHAEYTEGKETVWGKKMRAWLKGLAAGPSARPNNHRGRTRQPHRQPPHTVKA